MAKQNNCNKCGGFETVPEGECHKCDGTRGHSEEAKKTLNETDAESFANAIVKAKGSIPLDRRWRIDVHDTIDYANDRLYVSNGGSCVAIEPSGNIISVCRMNGDIVRGRDLLSFAVEKGGDRLDAFGKVLYNFYTRNGFEPVSWTPFNKEYAHFEWREAKKQGLDVEEEPVIFYKYSGIPYAEKYEDFIKNKAPCEGEDGYDKAMKIRDEELNNDVQK